MSKFSKFADVLKQAHKDPEPDGLVEAEPEAAAVEPMAAKLVPPPAPLVEASPAKIGRPKGKRSDPSYEQVTAYLPRALYKRVRLALMQADDRQDFSDLVADLLTEWSDRQKPE